MSPRDRDEETGEFSEQYGSEQFIDAIEAVEIPTTSAVADSVGCSYNLAYRRLRELEETGKVTRQEVGSSFLWKVK